MKSHVIEHDHEHNCWLCRLEGHGDPVIITDSLARMEEFLDAMDMQTRNRNGFRSHSGGRVMLVLTRKHGESFKIGEAVIKIIRMDGSRVKIGIEAPKDVLISRSELKPHTSDDRNL